MRALLVIVMLILPLRAAADHGHEPAGPACPDAALACATAATPHVGAQGRLWLVWSAADKVMVARSDDQGASFAAPVAASVGTDTIDDNGEARPQLVELADGTLIVSWVVRRDKTFNGTLMVTRSSDGGRSFAPPRPLIGGEASASQRFQSLSVLADGSVLAL